MPHITPRVYGILTQSAYLNAYLIQHTDALTLVDTGMGSAFLPAIEAALKALGKSWWAVRHIVLTHCHYDHMDNLAAIQRQTQATTYAHRLDAPIIRGEQPVQYADPVTLGFVDRLIWQGLNRAGRVGRVDETLKDGDVLDFIAPGAQVVHLPGHTYGQIGLWLPDERTLIGGDVMLRLPWGCSVPIKAASPDWPAVKASIRRAASMKPETLCVGHGAPLVGNAHRAIERLARRL